MKIIFFSLLLLITLVSAIAQTPQPAAQLECVLFSIEEPESNDGYIEPPWFEDPSILDAYDPSAVGGIQSSLSSRSFECGESDRGVFHIPLSIIVYLGEDETLADAIDLSDL